MKVFIRSLGLCLMLVIGCKSPGGASALNEAPNDSLGAVDRFLVTWFKYLDFQNPESRVGYLPSQKMIDSSGPIRFHDDRSKLLDRLKVFPNDIHSLKEYREWYANLGNALYSHSIEYTDLRILEESDTTIRAAWTETFHVEPLVAVFGARTFITVHETFTTTALFLKKPEGLFLSEYILTPIPE